ncbi:MAG: hypothetical protein ACXWUL_03650 [Caldimonas sp.]
MWVGMSSSLAPVVQLRGIRIANALGRFAAPLAALAAATAVLSWRSVASTARSA